MTLKIQQRQARGLEDAVLTLLGEQELGLAEVTQPGVPVWGLLERLDQETKAGQPRQKRTGKMAKIGFSTRRSENELPWGLLADEAPATP